MPNVMSKGATLYYLTYDQVGSLRAVYDATGAIVKRMDYDSFGNIIADTNPTFTVPFGFAGGLNDQDIGLVHFGFRDYDPATGRWTAKDPIGFAGVDVDLYGYVLNNPINWIDPWGLTPCPEDENTNLDPDSKSWGDYWDQFWGTPDEWKYELGNAAERWWDSGAWMGPPIAAAIASGGIVPVIARAAARKVADSVWKKLKDNRGSTKKEHTKNKRQSTSDKHTKSHSSKKPHKGKERFRY